MSEKTEDSSTRDETGRSGGKLSKDEIALRRFEALISLGKIIFGTFIVGVASVLIPAAVDYFTVQLEAKRKDTELQLAEQAAHQEYIKTFFETAIHQDIDLRIRFADYFTHLSGDKQKALWTQYHADLVKLRDSSRTRINELETQLVALKQADGPLNNVAFDRVTRELTWANKEIGYTPTERSAVDATAASAAPAAYKDLYVKLGLYHQATSLVNFIARSAKPISDLPLEVESFWRLYRKDLIGIESHQFAQIMIAIGKEITKLEASKSPPNEELKALAVQLDAQAGAERNAETWHDYGSQMTPLPFGSSEN